MEYTGLSSGVQYACGPCEDDTEGKTCETCTGNAETACNTKKATGSSFQCHDYELSGGKFVMKDEVTTCQVLASTKETKCKMPGDFADENYELKKSGCGGCSYADKAAGQCADCDTERCNKTPIKCIQGDGSDMTARMCVPKAGKAPPTKCHQ